MPILNRVALMFKRGDNGPEHFNGAPICHIDELDWGLPLETIISQHCSKAFLPVIVDRRMLPFIIAGYAPVYDKGVIVSPMTTVKPLFSKSIRMDFSTLESSLGISGLKDRLGTVESVGILDGTRLTEQDFVSTKSGLPADTVKDVMLITSGSYTVGSGGNYATWALFAADLGTLIAMLTGTQISAITETATAAFANALAGFTLNITSSVDPLGNFGAGWLTTYSQNGDFALFSVNGSSTTLGAVVFISKLNIKYTGTAGLVGTFINFISNTTNITHKLSNSLADCNGKRGRMCNINAANCIGQIHNCVCTGGVDSVGYSSGFMIQSGSTGSIIENCTVYNMTGTRCVGFWNYANIAVTIKNMACLGNTADYAYGSGRTLGLGSSVASKCASSDTTGSEAALRSLTAATEFESLDIAQANFLKIAAGATKLHNSGVAPSIVTNTYGIRGNARPHGGTIYSIGADEKRIVSGVPFPIFG